MMACVVIFETKPALPLVTTMANALLKESSLQVASFTYSHMKVLAISRIPQLFNVWVKREVKLSIVSSDFHYNFLSINAKWIQLLWSIISILFRSAACNIALKLLSPRLDRLSYRYSKVIHVGGYYREYQICCGTALANIIFLENSHRKAMKCHEFQLKSCHWQWDLSIPGAGKAHRPLKLQMSQDLWRILWIASIQLWTEVFV